MFLKEPYQIGVESSFTFEFEIRMHKEHIPYEAFASTDNYTYYKLKSEKHEKLAMEIRDNIYKYYER